MREIIIDTDKGYQFSSCRNYLIVIYEYFGNGKVKKYMRDILIVLLIFYRKNLTLELYG